MTVVQHLVRGIQRGFKSTFDQCDVSLALSLQHVSVLTCLCFGFTAAIGPDGLCCQSREFKEWHGCRSTKGVTKGMFLTDDAVTFDNLTFLFTMTSWSMSLCPGKYYYEVTCHDQGLCRIGWSTSQAALDLGKHHTALSTLAILKHSRVT